MPDEPKLVLDTPDQLTSLLGVYASRYASYTTLLWQVPALSLTAQAFLLTIALSRGRSEVITPRAGRMYTVWKGWQRLSDENPFR